MPNKGLAALNQVAFDATLQQFDDLAEDVLRSDHRTFEDNLRNLVGYARTNPLTQNLYEELRGPENFESFFNEAFASRGSMVGSGRFNWPQDSRARLFLQISLLEAIADGKINLYGNLLINFFYASSRHDDNIQKFNDQLVRQCLREYRKRLIDAGTKRLKAGDHSTTPNSMELEIFISHSSKDDALANAVARLLRNALDIQTNAIRCTSAPGFKLPLGANTDEQIKREVSNSKIFIAILTPTSLKSAYVLFELGARWGKGLFLGPLLARGATAGFLGGPITGINALHAENEADLHQFLGDVGKALGRSQNRTESFLNDLKEVAEEAGKPVDQGNAVNFLPIVPISFPSEETKAGVFAILKSLVRADRQEETEANIQNSIQQSLTMTQLFIAFGLKEALFERDQVRMRDGLKLTAFGKKFALENKIS